MKETKEIILAFYDGDEEYASQMTEYMERQKNLPWCIHTYTEMNKLIEQEKGVNILLVAESVYCEELKELQPERLVVLNESGIIRDRNLRYINKYQQADQVVKELLVFYLEIVPQVLPRLGPEGNSIFIGFFSPVRRSYQTTFALSMAQLLSGEHRTLYEILIGSIPAQDALVQTELAKLHLIPSHINLVGAEIELLDVPERESVLRKALEPIRDNYDFIIIDCSPSLGLITVNCLTAADSVMIPVQPEFFALEGLTKLIQTIRLVQSGINPRLTIEGFVVTMFDGRTKVHSQVVMQLREHFKDMVFNTIISRSIRLSEAPSYGKPIILYDVMNNGTSNYMNLAKEVLDKYSESNG